MKKESYQCSVCLKTYLMGWSKEDAIAEKEKFSGDAPLEECDIDIWDSQIYTLSI